MLASSSALAGIDITVEDATPTGSLYNTTATFTAPPVIESFSSYIPGQSYSNVSFGTLGTIDGFAIGASTIQGIAQQYAINYGAAPSSIITINFGQRVNYFGINLLWVNGGNTVTFYNGSNKVIVFNDVTLKNFVSSNLLYEQNGAGRYINEPSAFINFYDDSSDGGFTKVILSGPNFESNNYTLGNYLTKGGSSILNNLIVNSPISGAVPIDIRNGAYTGLINNSIITASAVGVYNLNNDLYTLDNNSGGIITSGVWGIQNSSAIGTLNNYAGASINGSNGAILNDVGNSITKIINAGTIGKYDLLSSDYGILNYSASSAIDQIYNTGSIYGNVNAIKNNGSISSITNTGHITNGISGIDIENSGVINVLNNLQGKSSSPLFYSGVLPSNYNIIINSPSNYGQLFGSSLSGSVNFGIFQGSIISSKLYLGVLQGLVDSDISGAKSGKYEGINWALSLETGSSTIWDLIFSGSLTVDTQTSIQYQANQLRSAFNAQSTSANFSLNYDCNIFDNNDVCISAGGKYTSIDNPNINNSAAIVVLGYKINPYVRIGGYLDQNININSPVGIHINNKTPLLGANLIWNEQENSLGYQLKLANAYQEQDVTSIRKIFNTSEPGSGKSLLISQSYLAELSYAFKYDDKNVIRQYIGLRYTNLKQDGYTESQNSSVADPLTVSALKDRSTTALLGLKLNHLLTDKASIYAQAGVEQDLHHKIDNYLATDLNSNTLLPIAFNNDIKKIRAVASLGTSYIFTKTQRASATINYTQLPFQSTNSITGYFNYTIGF